MRTPTTRAKFYQQRYADGEACWRAVNRWPMSGSYTDQELEDALWEGLHRYFTPQGRQMALNDPAVMTMIRMGVQWVASTMPVVEVPELVAAALCVTSVAFEPGDEAFQAPWRGFAIEVPPGLIQLVNPEGQTEDIFVIFVDRSLGFRPDETMQQGWSFVAVAPTTELSQCVLTTEELFCDDPRSFPGVFFENTSEMLDLDFRALTLCRALVRGVILRCTDPDNRTRYHKTFGSSPKARAARRAKYGALPDFDRYVITDTVAIDAREVVRQFARGERSSPSVRHLVRGHFRNQVCGAGRADRKRIWIQPHWRGEEGLPIATKNHRLASP